MLRIGIASKDSGLYPNAIAGAVAVVERIIAIEFDEHRIIYISTNEWDLYT